ncbi:unnamed protein product, partial [Polarella glacialis]
QGTMASWRGGGTTTTVWRTSETSLTRDSFNCLVSHKKADAVAIIMKTSTMSRRAMNQEPTVGYSLFAGSAYAPPSPKAESSLPNITRGDSGMSAPPILR